MADGTYRIELYFTEPWHGTGGSASTDCEGLRIFDVAVNDSVVLDDLDIWAESGHDGVCKKIVYTTVKGGMLKIHFPEVTLSESFPSLLYPPFPNSNRMQGMLSVSVPDLCWQ